MILTHGANSLERGGGDFVEIGGRKYKYVQIGNLLWLAENLDYKFDVNGSQIPVGGSNASEPRAWYYNNDEATYGIDGTYKCGLLYNGYAASYLEDHKSSLLPDGWRVPLKADFNALVNDVGGIEEAQHVMAEPDSVSQGYPPASWEGTDEYGFSAVPSGFKDYNTFKCFDTEFYMWSATSLNSSYNTSLRINLYGGKWSFTTGDYFYQKQYCSLSIRLVKDAT